MSEEFDGGVPNARVMISDVTVPEALVYKEKLEAVEGVAAVDWLDDAVNLNVPLNTLDTKTVETYYKNGNALFSITIDTENSIDATAALREIVGEDNAVSGPAPSIADTTTNTVVEVGKLTGLAILLVFII